MISLELWRAKIGLFNCSRPPSSSLFTNLHHHQQSVAHGWFLAGGGGGDVGLRFSSQCRSLLIRRALVLLLVAVITHLLLSAGDVEQNPGPIFKDAKPTLQDLQYMSYNSEDGGTVHFRLMDRIKPRVTQLAIALIFPQHIIANLKAELDPVFYLLNEWLIGGNQENDPRPLTWETLITALQHARLLEEAEILKKHFVVPAAPPAQRAISSARHRHPDEYNNTSVSIVSEVQEVAELKEEDIITGKLCTATAGVSGDLSRTLGTGDLVDVLAVVRDINNWKELGLQLGLLYPSLERIDLEQRGRITFSIMHMLSAWLQQQDNVLQKGVPSWSVLRAALQSMGEHETADRIHSN